jgi:hypothetical protein
MLYDKTILPTPHARDLADFRGDILSIMRLIRVEISLRRQVRFGALKVTCRNHDAFPSSSLYGSDVCVGHGFDEDIAGMRG